MLPVSPTRTEILDLSGHLELYTYYCITFEKPLKHEFTQAFLNRALLQHPIWMNQWQCTGEVISELVSQQDRPYIASSKSETPIWLATECPCLILSIYCTTCVYHIYIYICIHIRVCVCATSVKMSNFNMSIGGFRCSYNCHGTLNGWLFDVYVLVKFWTYRRGLCHRSYSTTGEAEVDHLRVYLQYWTISIFSSMATG